jgi:hypothetical protein
MIFEFKLSPLEGVHVWGEHPNTSLSWFGLTQGDYRIKVGSEYLFNYSEPYTKYLIKTFPEYSFNTTLVDYYVVRLWEDILEILPSILEPVPKEIQHYLDSGYENYLALENKATGWQESQMKKGMNETATWKIVELANSWLNNRWLDSAYLSPSARIWIWSDESDVIVSWDNREIKVETIPVWSASYGNYRINKEDFINVVRKFNNYLFAEMYERVETVCQNWKDSKIKVDFENLKSEQKNRATWLENSLNKVHKTDWIGVTSAIKTVNL